ncbi:MAG: glycosyltransferase family 2 protein [Anaerolineaceae bacterium]|nr:glycosyltransferase family 2 protein [Anaerolineaceae bacterium]
MNRNKILVVMPAYNEVGIIGESIAKVLSEGYRLVVVDDGSNDDTFKKALEYPCYLLKHKVNLGQGAAIQTGITFGLKHTDCEVFFTFDADGQHHVEDIEVVAGPILDKSTEVVLGSRFAGIESENMPKSRRFF